MIADETPILESVFVDLAEYACDIKEIAGYADPGWFWEPLSYRELAEWIEEGGITA